MIFNLYNFKKHLYYQSLNKTISESAENIEDVNRDTLYRSLESPFKPVASVINDSITYNDPLLELEGQMNIGIAILLFIITCGIYGLV